jgi:hypothetical protein
MTGGTRKPGQERKVGTGQESWDRSNGTRKSAKTDEIMQPK